MKTGISFGFLKNKFNFHQYNMSKIFGLIRFHTTFRIHQTATKMRWYKEWHETKGYKVFHAFVFVIYMLSVFTAFLGYPTQSYAAWNNSKSWTTKSDFETGTVLSNVAVSGDDDAGDANDNDDVYLDSQSEKKQTIAAGNGYSIALKADGTLWGTGYNNLGSLGLGDFVYRNTWTQIPITDVVSVSAHYYATAVLKSDGTVWGTGSSPGYNFGGSSNAYTNTFVQARTGASTYLTNVKQIYTSLSHSLAITNDNKLYVCGAGERGKLGFGDTATKTYFTQVTTLGSLTNFIPLSVRATEYSSMILVLNLDNGKNELYGTGYNNYGELGLGDNTQRTSWTLSPLDDVLSLEGSWAYHYAAIVKNDTDNYVVYTVGAGDYGRLGSGDYANSNVWIRTTMEDVSEIFMGYVNTFAIKRDGTVWGTGRGSFGVLNTDNLSHSTVFVQTKYEDITEMSINQNFALSLDKTGNLDFVGINYDAQAGNGADVYRNTITQTDFSGVTEITAGHNNSFGLKNNYLWGTGYNDGCRLGFSDATNHRYFTQTSMSGISKFVEGGSAIMVIKNDGTLWGMGINDRGQIGSGTTLSSNCTFSQSKTDSSTYLTDITDVAAGNGFNLAMKADGTVYAAGYNNYCNLGMSGCTYPGTSQVYWVQVATGASKIVAGYYSSYILKTDGTLMVVGYNNNGQLGIGNTTRQDAWQTSATGVLDIWAGFYGAYIKKADGIYATGDNESGQLGTGDTTDKLSWTKVTALDGVDIESIAAGYLHTIVLKTDGTALAVGWNYYGQLGLGDFVRRSTWQNFPLSGIEQVSAGQYHTVVLKTDGTVWTAGFDCYGQLGLNVSTYTYDVINVLTSVKQPAPFLTPGTLSGLIVDAGETVNWINAIWSVDISNSSVFKIRTRGAPTQEGLASASWSNYLTTSGDNLQTANSRWLEAELLLESANGTFTPTVSSLTVNYYSDLNAPTNPTETLAWVDSSKAVALSGSTWLNSNDIYLEWTGAADTGGSEVKGYWVYFGTDPTADPKTSGSFQVASNYETSLEDTDSGKTYYLCVSAEDNAGNRYTIDESPYYRVFEYKFDKTIPDIDTANQNVNPVGWAVTNSFAFTWQDVSDPLTNGDASGVAGYQYKRKNGQDEWSTISTAKSITEVEAYQNGQNILELKAIDNAGNESKVKEISYYYNADAPTPPQNLRVTPQSSEENNFEFEWEAPASANGGVKGYYYSVNAIPNKYNSVYITNTNSDEIHAATQQDLNVFYVVAMDNSDNINWGNYISVQFECNTPAPGSPTNPEIFDTSNRDLQKYSIALSWTEPQNMGAGFSGYLVERSTDNTTFAQIGSSAGTSYIDTGLESKVYYYRLISEDNSNNTSAPSTVVSLTPTGKYTSPPDITVDPEAITKVSTAEIKWVTDRQASSFVEIGESVEYGLTQGQFDSVVNHDVLIERLKPDTIYHYRVKFVDVDGNVGYSPDATLTTLPAPRVAAVTISDIRLDSAVITCRTTSSAKSSIYYGKSANYGSVINDISGGFTTSHAIRIDGLDHSSTYHLAILVTDIDGNEVLSDDYTFDTQKFPVISLIRVEPVRDSSNATMKVTWQTNVPTNSVFEYKPTGGVTQEAVKSKLETSHELIITGLIDNMYYTTLVKAMDQFGNIAVSEEQKFKTDYDTRPPVVNNLSYESSSSGYGTDAKTQVVIYWETDEPATSQIEYGIGLSGEYNTKTLEDMTLGTSHVVVVSNLKSSSSYHFRAVSHDGSSNEGVSEENSILTEQAKSSVLDMVVTTLQSALGWLFSN